MCIIMSWMDMRVEVGRYHSQIAVQCRHMTKGEKNKQNGGELEGCSGNLAKLITVEYKQDNG